MPDLFVIVPPELVRQFPGGAPLPRLNYTEPFMPPNSNIPMHTPDEDRPRAAQTAPATMPVEKLIESMKPQTPLVPDNSTTTGSYSAGSSTTSAAPAGPQ